MRSKVDLIYIDPPYDNKADYRTKITLSGGEMETKVQGQINTPNVKRKKRAAVAWCDKINVLVLEQRSHAEWHYVFLGEDVFYEWRDKGASIHDMLNYAKLRSVDERLQATFAF